MPGSVGTSWLLVPVPSLSPLMVTYGVSGTSVLKTTSPDRVTGGLFPICSFNLCKRGTLFCSLLCPQHRRVSGTSQGSRYFIYIYMIYFYFWLCWVFVAVWAFLQLQQVGDTLQLPCTGFSLRWLLLLRSTGSRAHWAHRPQQLWHVGSRAQTPQLWLTGSAAPRHQRQYVLNSCLLLGNGIRLMNQQGSSCINIV